ncbi:hypothetical protein FIBSPDRAFT_925026 [Athelia psychrophila]|uniref:Uncharacterized protein n=1 Tax=Athelia psychrophila TaxID=1759441 RepID=A0A166VAC3_9AGAM|nr:hypothetical protein FIBSPDRAFT_925026 [Fibularhizoctonia sp. CBS 109695]
MHTHYQHRPSTAPFSINLSISIDSTAPTDSTAADHLAAADHPTARPDNGHGLTINPSVVGGQRQSALSPAHRDAVAEGTDDRGVVHTRCEAHRGSDHDAFEKNAPPKEKWKMTGRRRSSGFWQHKPGDYAVHGGEFEEAGARYWRAEVAHSASHPTVE